MSLATRLKRQQLHIGAPAARSRQLKARADRSFDPARNFLGAVKLSHCSTEKPMVRPTTRKALPHCQWKDFLLAGSEYPVATCISHHPWTTANFWSGDGLYAIVAGSRTMAFSFCVKWRRPTRC